MKKMGFYVLLGVLVVLLSSCLSFDSFFPGASAPVDGKASMLVVEAGTREGSSTTMLFNSNATGWAPWVEDQEGALIPFRVFDSETRLDSLYWAENLASGTYTLKGFLHVYADYGMLPEGVVMAYEPFANRPWHVVQHFALDQPVTLTLKEGEMASFGRYFITSAWVEGAGGTRDTRWRVDPASVKIDGDRQDKKALRVIKGWAAPTWLAWNTRNPERAGDR
ncbi:MAG TPA: hypothetical protein PLX25_04490 [Sphaerochaeta sp.]|nr:hypothetical protein [Sphaerochaeta sp.]